MSANDIQIAGSHYRDRPYQHWDLVIALRMGYLEGNITKYATRWRFKNGVEDLHKSRHYLVKLIENAHVVGAPSFGDCLWRTEEATRYCSVNKLGVEETEIVLIAADWSTRAHLERALHVLEGLIAAHREPEPVPLTEENHHAPRAYARCSDLP